MNSPGGSSLSACFSHSIDSLHLPLFHLHHNVLNQFLSRIAAFANALGIPILSEMENSNSHFWRSFLQRVLCSKVTTFDEKLMISYRRYQGPGLRPLSDPFSRLNGPLHLPLFHHHHQLLKIVLLAEAASTIYAAIPAVRISKSIFLQFWEMFL